MQNSVLECEQIVENILSDYYYAKDNNLNFDFKNKFSSLQLEKFMESKLKFKQLPRTITQYTLTNYKSGFKILEKQDIDRAIKMTVKVDVEFIYSGETMKSGYGEIVQIILVEKVNSFKIADWYVDSDPYDVMVRGENLTIKEPLFWDNSKKVSYISSNNKVMQNSIENYCQTMKSSSNREINENEIEDITAMATLKSLNRNAMIQYALNNCSEDNPSSGGSGVRYFDFSTISNNYDCTNFISHCLLSGGAKPYNTKNANTGWFYNGQNINKNERSYSWSGVPNLYSFIVNNKVKGPVGYRKEYNTFAIGTQYPYECGDILQIDYSGNGYWRHSTLITGYSEYGMSRFEAKVTSRTGRNGAYQCNRPLSEVYGGLTYRVIKLTGYYE